MLGDLPVGEEQRAGEVIQFRVVPERFVQIDDPKRIGHTGGLGRAGERAAGLEHILHRHRFGRALRLPHDRGVADFDRHPVQGLRHRRQHALARHDVDDAHDAVVEFFFGQLDHRPEFLQPLQVPLAKFVLIARLHAFHARDRHEQVDEQTTLDPLRDHLDVLRDRRQPRRVRLEQREKALLAVVGVEVGDLAGDDRGGLVLQFRRSTHRRPDALVDELSLAPGFLLDLLVVSERFLARTAPVGIVAGRRPAQRHERLGVEPAHAERLFRLDAAQPVDLAVGETVRHRIDAVFLAPAAGNRHVRLDRMRNDEFLLQRRAAIVPRRLHLDRTVLDLEHVDDLQNIERELAIERIDVQPAPNVAEILPGARKVQPDDVLGILVDDDRRSSEHDQIAKSLSHLAVEIGLFQHRVEARLNVLEPCLAVRLQRRPRYADRQFEPRSRR